MSKLLILPGDPEFAETLGTPPPNWRQFAQNSPEFAFVARSDTGLLEPVGMTDLEEYLYGGEYDERLGAIDDDDEFEGFEV